MNNEEKKSHWKVRLSKTLLTHKALIQIQKKERKKRITDRKTCNLYE